MSFSHGSKAKLYSGGYDLSAYLSSVATVKDRDMAEVSTLGLGDKAFIPGLRDGTFALEGFWDGLAGAIDPIFAAAMSDEAGVVVAHLPAGDVLGARAKYGLSLESAFEITTPVDGASAITAEWKPSGGLDAGVVLHVLGPETIDGNGTGVDGLVSSANGGAAYLELTAFSGFSSIVVKVQHSTNDSTYLDLATFATVTAPNKSERVVVAGTVNRYLRALWDVTGTGTATFHVGFARR